MQIKFHGQQNTEEAMESIVSMFKLFEDRYGICDFRELNLDLVLMNHEGDDVELIDAGSSEVLDIFEVYQSDNEIKPQYKKPELSLVVDNTKK